MTEDMSAKLEYTQTRFNRVGTTIGGVKGSDNLINHSVKAGSNIRF
ncbi:hypothetical protein [Ensifer sp.]|nr:hypothetical protein [Ensifer sp.]